MKIEQFRVRLGMLFWHFKKVKIPFKKMLARAPSLKAERMARRFVAICTAMWPACYAVIAMRTFHAHRHIAIASTSRSVTPNAQNVAFARHV
jgi:hypothetical protein